MPLSFNALGLLLHHTEDNPNFTESELERIIVAAESKCDERIDREEACMKLALLRSAVASGERWYKVAHHLTTPDSATVKPKLVVTKRVSGTRKSRSADPA